jgi:hypothetical protein
MTIANSSDQLSEESENAGLASPDLFKLSNGSFPTKMFFPFPGGITHGLPQRATPCQDFKL